MERRPILINASRGGLVDEVALGDALRSGQIAGAGFDVATAEPPPADHPLMGLLDLPNFILTPHVAWASRGGQQALADQLVDNIDAFWRGSPRNVVGRASPENSLRVARVVAAVREFGPERVGDRKRRPGDGLLPPAPAASRRRRWT